MKKNDLIKKIIRFASCAVATALLLLPAAMSAAADSGKPTASVTSTSASAGDVVTVEVVFENAPGVAAFLMDFDYDDSRLSLNTVELAPDTPGLFEWYTRAVWAYTSDVEMNGTVLTLSFTVLSDAVSGDAYVKIHTLTANNWDEEAVSFELKPGSITVDGLPAPEGDSANADEGSAGTGISGETAGVIVVAVAAVIAAAAAIGVSLKKKKDDPADKADGAEKTDASDKTDKVDKSDETAEAEKKDGGAGESEPADGTDDPPSDQSDTSDTE